MEDKILASKQVTYNSIDLFKFLMAFCVVAIHTHPLESCMNSTILSFYNSAVACAVPFFFLATGFLLANKFDGINDLQIIKKQIIKLIRMYVFWTVVYTPLEIYHALSNGVSPVKEVLLYIRGLLLIGEHYNSWPLWYLLSSIYGLLFLYFLKKKKAPINHMLIISVWVMILSFSIDSLVSAINLPFPLTLLQKLINKSIGNGRILRGLFFIPLGAILNEKPISLIMNVFAFIFGFAASIFLDDFLGIIPIVICSIGLFGIVTSFQLPNNRCYLTMRTMSTVIYLIHMYVWSFYYWIVYKEKTYGFDSFIIVSIVSALIAYLWIIIQPLFKSKRIITIAAREKKE